MASRPTGTVTFLFTDLEGSTISWEKHPVAMADALARHDRILRAAIDVNGGFIFSTAGDAFGAAFASGPAAARAAAEAQRALRCEPWPVPVRLASRMGLHTGSSHERDDNYFGPAVNRAARIMATGSGGQVLVSAATAALLAASDAALADLGVHRLRDLLAPEHLYQLVVDGDDGAHPPLRVPERGGPDLPITRSSFHGRESAVARLEDELEAPGLLTLTGSGGVGKTRLALEVAARELDAFDGTFFVDLAVVTDAEAVPAALAGALGIPPDGGVSAAVRMLQSRSVMLVVDNCEQVVDTVADLTEHIIRHCPRCTILATSREPLGIDGERVWRVPPLDARPAADLFVERALAVRPDLVVDDSAQAAIDEVAMRLDGLPLALELAAARVSHLSVAEISEHLDERFQLLAGGRRRARARQQTLSATMDWSYDLLAPEEQSLLRVCSVFIGGFTLAALAGVSELPSAVVLDQLGSLVRKSLVLADQSDDSPTRYRLLETVRLYGQERLIAAGEASSRRELHAQWFMRSCGAALDLMLEQWMPSVGEATHEPFRDRDNLLAALEWCDDQGDLPGVGMLATELMALSDMYEWTDASWRYLGRDAVLDALQDSGRARYLWASASNANALGDFARQRSLSQRALPLVGPSALRALVLFELSVATSVIDVDEADRIADEALALLPPGSPMANEALQVKAGSATMRGDLAATVELRERGSSRGFSQTELGIVLHILGQHDRVRDLLASSAVSGTEWYAFRWGMLGALSHAAAEQPEEAVVALGGAARMVDRFPSRLLDRDVLVAAAALAHWRGDVHRCAVLLAVEEETLTMRSPSSWQLYLHYRRLARACLSADGVAAARSEARQLSVPIALSEELDGRS